MQGKLVILLLVAALYVASAKSDVGVHNCPANEQWSLCGKVCEPSCRTPNPKLCPRLACTKFTAGCRCKAGYVRTVPKSGRCIPKNYCSDFVI